MCKKKKNKLKFISSLVSFILDYMQGMKINKQRKIYIIILLEFFGDIFNLN